MNFLFLDKPGNLTVSEGTQIDWNGPACVGSAITYRVEITRISDGDFERITTITGDTSIIVSNLQPNQEYTVSVSAVGSSCTSDPATKSFMVQASDSVFSASKCGFNYTN